jgi:hypothetical protein
MRNNQGRHLKKRTSTFLPSHAETETRGVDVIDTGERREMRGVDVLDVGRDAETRGVGVIDEGPREDK